MPIRENAKEMFCRCSVVGSVSKARRPELYLIRDVGADCSENVKSSFSAL